MMKTGSSIHSHNHRLKDFLGNMLESLGNLSFPSGELVVLNYHGTQKKFLPDFERQLDFYQQNFILISPSEMDDYYKNKLNEKRKPMLLITFDDGIKNNLHAAEILKKRNLKAYFFVIPGFIDSPDEKQKDFFFSNIRPLIHVDIDNHAEDFSSLSWEELKTLANDGHHIGSHTCTHTLIAHESLPDASAYEICQSKKIIEKNLQLSINAYCSPNDTLLSTGKKEIDCIRENYSFHFSTFPGSNLENKNPYFIKRVNVEAHWLPGAVKYALCLLDRKRWEKKVRRFDALIR